ncbi:hypothetical protein EVAR_99790_1 [Eumeta japonica]|uniref:Uncharacterized protein n=1 Tax=Eumeta variegata TaxID=151549 RepID=A0A4C1ZCY2_EUMVA|nr:hypothetical protein EVAR_99790_1 [Eumeta japonica]
MRSLPNECGMSFKYRCRNSDARGRCALKEDVVTRAERGMLRRFGHLERVNESRQTKQSIERMCMMERALARGAGGSRARASPTALYIFYISVNLSRCDGIGADRFPRGVKPLNRDPVFTAPAPRRLRHTCLRYVTPDGARYL